MEGGSRLGSCECFSPHPLGPHPPIQMSKLKKRNRGELPTTERVKPVVDPSDNSCDISWSKTARRVATIVILVYLTILLLGPLSNPIAPPHLIGPLAASVSPVHRMLYQGHGYRFFAPDPGPSHRMIYRGTRADGTKFNGHFPDRENHSPRLIYHRWFMLAERMAFEQNLRVPEQQFQSIRQQYDREILNLRNIGKRELSHELARERDQGIELHDRNQVRFKVLAGAVAQILLDRHNGDRIELFVQERGIPFPVEVANGVRLTDERFLSELTKIGELDSSGFHATPPPPIPMMEETL